MSASRNMSVLLAVLAGSRQALAEESNPLGTVIGLMNDLSAKIKADGEAEEKAYKEYFEWCDDVSKNKQFEIETATSQKEKLEATIGELSAEIEATDTKIAELSESIATGEADLKSATDIRTKESEEFAASEKELVEAVDTLGRALNILEKEMAKNPAALTQLNTNDLNAVVQSIGAIVDAAAFPATDKKRLMALVQQRQDAQDGDEEMGAPAAAVYKSQSGGIVDVIADMQGKAEEELSELRKTEKTAQHNFNMLKQSLEDQLAVDNKDMDASKSKKAADEEAKATATGELDVTVKELKASKDALASAQSNCMNVASDHEATVKSREGELKVVAEATKILEETSGGAVEQTYSLLQTRTGVTLKTHADLARSEVIAAVKKLAREHHSAALAQLVSRMTAVMRYGSAAGADPFVKIRGLITDMIAKLEKEAEDEATEKAYCDEEMSKSKAKKAELDTTIGKLTTKIDQAASKSAALKGEVSTLQEELATMEAEQAEATKVREEEHAEYLVAKSDLETGLTGVRKALDVLTEYYAAKGSALLQQPEPPMPKGHSASGGAADSIINILQVCESDFADNLAKTETEESDAASSYEAATQEYKMGKTEKSQDVKYKTQEFTGLDKSIADLSGDRDTEYTELAAVEEYLAKLTDRCVAKPETYEERKKRRDAEVAGLKEALSVLENETAFMQRKRKGHHMRGSLAAGL